MFRGKSVKGVGVGSQSADEAISFGSFEARAGRLVPSLKSVAISGEVHGLLFKSVIRQEYRNDTDKNLEVIYTFPLAWGTALLGLRVEIGGKRLEGVVIEKKAAEEQYEKSLAEGDSPVMVQQSQRGLYTANLGNIKAGEAVTVEISCARLLRFEQRRIRLCIPTVISERYGDSHAPGGLAPHESAKVSATARYPLSLQLRIFGDVARGGVTSPSHSIISSAIDNGLSITLGEGATLDRDFVLLMEGLSNPCLAQYLPGEEESLLLASFTPVIHQHNSVSLGLKILVDCSGSMQGQRIEQTKKGLSEVLFELLREGDHVSYSRFGSHVQHMSNELQDFYRGGDIFVQLSKTEADMGGTEMERALVSTFTDIAMPQDLEFAPAVLLITDGDVWDAEGIIRTAKASGHRIFAIGVGAAPAESLLREMSEQTGGACECVTSGEDIREAMVRMIRRIRKVPAQNLGVHWGVETVWQSTLPQYIYDRDTVHCFAITTGQPKTAPSLLWTVQGQAQVIQANKLELATDSDLLRLAKVRQMEDAPTPEEKLDIALKHQLVSDATSLFLVYLRDGEDKLASLPTLQHIEQMPAYGHGCYSSMVACGSMSIPCYMRQSTTQEVSAMSASKSEKARAPIEVLDDFIFYEDVLALWQKAVYQAASFSECLDMIQDKCDAEYATLLADIAKAMDLTSEQAWAIFIQWVLETSHGGNGLERHEQRLLNTVLPGIPPDKMAKARERVIDAFL